MDKLFPPFPFPLFPFLFPLFPRPLKEKTCLMGQVCTLNIYFFGDQKDRSSMYLSVQGWSVYGRGEKLLQNLMFSWRSPRNEVGPDIAIRPGHLFHVSIRIEQSPAFCIAVACEGVSPRVLD